jgi:CheY-like chemotaxis protein
MGSHERAIILIVDDNPGDAVLIEALVRERRSECIVHYARDGLEMLNYLISRKNSMASLPNLVLLDLNMPRMDGHEALKAIKTDAALRHIPVVIFTSSSSDEDVQRCYANHANGYLKKPFGFDGYQKIIDAVDRYWFDVCELPRGNEDAF